MSKFRLRTIEERMAKIESLRNRLSGDGTLYQKGVMQGLEFALGATSAPQIAVELNRLKTYIDVADIESGVETYDPMIAGTLSAFCWVLGGEIPEFDNRT